MLLVLGNLIDIKNYLMVLENLSENASNLHIPYLFRGAGFPHDFPC